MNNMRVIVDEAGRQGLKVFVQAGVYAWESLTFLMSIPHCH